MHSPWNDDQPIYRQLYERMTLLIMQGAIKEGDALPSVRQVSSDLQINHLTVAKAYQELADQGIVEKRRGLGMFVIAGARAQLLASEKHKFMQQELPQLLQRANQLGISAKELINTIKQLQEKS